MFNFQQNHMLEDHEFVEDQISHLLSPPVIQFPLDNTIHLPPAAGGRKKRKRATAVVADGGDTTNEKNVKKITHREIEKQRRQEMAKLYASLRSLLPLEYVKGKRSISDHMHQAVNYINNLQKKITELRSKKEIAFTKNPNLSTSSSGIASAESCSDRQALNTLCSTVTLNLCGNGIEILIRLNRKEEVFPISKMMRKMISEGLNVTSYLSSKTLDDAVLYSFITEVDDPSCIDISRLQKTLMDMIMQEPTSQ